MPESQETPMWCRASGDIWSNRASDTGLLSSRTCCTGSASWVETSHCPPKGGLPRRRLRQSTGLPT